MNPLNKVNTTDYPPPRVLSHHPMFLHVQQYSKIWTVHEDQQNQSSIQSRSKMYEQLISAVSSCTRSVQNDLNKLFNSQGSRSGHSNCNFEITFRSLPHPQEMHALKIVCTGRVFSYPIAYSTESPEEVAIHQTNRIHLMRRNWISQLDQKIQRL